MATSSRRQVFLHPGDQLAGYTIEEVLGVGGMAVVYRATQRSLERQVALKVLNASMSRNDEFRLRFQREGARVASLDHPNIVPVYDLDEANGHLYMAMRLVDGETLADRMFDGLSAEESIAILTDIAAALDAAHAAGVLHRDVKPHNILLDGDRRYLADFGIAKGAETTSLTRTGGFVGSFHYASPEQFLGGELSAASDVYSLAAVAYECLTGLPPFGKGSEVSIMDRRLHQPPPRLGGTKLSGGAHALSAALQRGLARQAGNRPQSAPQFVAELAEAAARLSPAERSRRPAFSEVPHEARAPDATPQLVTAGDETQGLSFIGRVGAAAETVDVPRGARPPMGPGLTSHDPRTSTGSATPPSSAPDRRRMRHGAPVALAVTALALPLGAWQATKDDPSRVLEIPGAHLTLPATWAAQPGDRAMFAGLKTAHPIAQASRRTTSGLGVVALGRIATGASTLTPDGAAAPERLVLGSALAYRYEAGSTDRVRRLVTVIPAAAGAVLVGCRLPAGDPDATTACDRATASVTSGVFTRSAEQSLTDAITEALAPVRRALNSPFPSTPERRAAAAQRIATRYNTAAVRLTTLVRKHPWDADLAAAARRTAAVGREYERIRTAAERRRTASDRSATATLRETNAALRQSLARIAARSGRQESST